MIFNCESCGKSISSKKDFCPYCKCDTAEFSLTLEKRKLEEKILEESNFKKDQECTLILSNIKKLT